MLDKLKLTEERYNEISEKLANVGVINDNTLYKELMREFKNLTPIVEKYREYYVANKAFEEAKEMLDAGGLDKDFKD